MHGGLAGQPYGARRRGRGGGESAAAQGPGGVPRGPGPGERRPARPAGPLLLGQIPSPPQGSPDPPPTGGGAGGRAGERRRPRRGRGPGARGEAGVPGAPAPPCGAPPFSLHHWERLLRLELLTNLVQSTRLCDLGHLLCPRVGGAGEGYWGSLCFRRLLLVVFSPLAFWPHPPCSPPPSPTWNQDRERCTTSRRQAEGEARGPPRVEVVSCLLRVLLPWKLKIRVLAPAGRPRRRVWREVESLWGGLAAPSLSARTRLPGRARPPAPGSAAARTPAGPWPCRSGT